MKMKWIRTTIGFLIVVTFYLKKMLVSGYDSNIGRQHRRCRDMKRNRKWWMHKWYWVFFILALLAIHILIYPLLNPEMPLSEAIGTAIFSAIVVSIVVVLGYFIYRRTLAKKFARMPDRIFRRIVLILFGAFCIGPFLWSFTVLPLAIYFDILDNPVVGVSFPAFMVITAIVLDIIGKRRDYRPFIEGSGNI